MNTTKDLDTQEQVEKDLWHAEQGSYQSDEYVITRELPDPNRDAAYTNTTTIARGMAKAIAERIVKEHNERAELIESLRRIQVHYNQPQKVKSIVDALLDKVNNQ